MLRGMRVLRNGLLVLGSFVAGAACNGQGPGAVDSPSTRAIAALVPADAVAYARIASLDALLATARSAAGAMGAPSTALTREQLLGQLGGMLGDTSLLDGSRTIGVALVAPRGVRPTPVVFLPVTDGAKYAASLKANGLEPVVEGDYVAIPFGGKYGKPTTPSALGTAKTAGLIEVRVDVAKASDNLGVVINSGLDVMRREMAKELSAAGSGIDGEAMVDLYVNGVKAMLAAGATLDLVITETKGILTATASCTAKPGSALDGWSSPPVDLSEFSGALTDKACVDVVATADWSKLWSKMEPMMDALFDIYPPALRKTFQSLMQTYQAVYAMMGPVMVGGLEVAEGMRMDVHIAPPKGKAMLTELDTLVQRKELADIGVQVTADAAASGEGSRAWKVTFDPSRMVGVPADDDRSKAVAAEMATMFQKLFGADALPVRAEIRDGRGVIGVGKPLAAAAKPGATAAGAWPARLQPALTALAGCNPMFVERIDFAAMMRGMGPLMASGRGTPPPMPPADAKADMVFGGGVRGAEWRLFFSIDLVGFGAMVKAMMPH